MTIIGVTGGVGTGKSSVAGMFRKLGAVVIDADQVTHELMRPRTLVWRRIRAAFGKTVLRPSGKLDRRRLGALVFSDPKKLARLCQIVHPAVRRRFAQITEAFRRRRPNATVIWDIPLLVEAGPIYRVDALVVVSAPLSVAAGRLKKRSGWSAEEVRRRQSFQIPLREKEKRADFVVRNGGSPAATRRQVLRIWKQIH